MVVEIGAGPKFGMPHTLMLASSMFKDGVGVNCVEKTEDGAKENVLPGGLTIEVILNAFADFEFVTVETKVSFC